ncbi:hypothetical protein L0244_06995, partial [bacterium]|nr:hypothetical protein [bacterium]
NALQLAKQEWVFGASIVTTTLFFLFGDRWLTDLSLVLSPEALSAIRAAIANDLQRSINILLGSVLASIGLTIPCVLMIGLFTEQTIILGLAPVNTILLVLTLGISALTFTSNRTNVLLGAVHLLLFLAYLMLIFES